MIKDEGLKFSHSLKYSASRAVRCQSEENMSLYDQINDEIVLMDAGEQKWIGQDLPLESMMAVELLLQDLQEDKVIKIRRKNHEKHTGMKQVDRILVEKL
jgi:hypothetical protein